MGHHTDRLTDAQEAPLTARAINAFMNSAKAAIERTTVIPAEKKSELLYRCNQEITGGNPFAARTAKQFPLFEKLPETFGELKEFAANAEGMAVGSDKERATFKAILQKALSAAEKEMGQGLSR